MPSVKVNSVVPEEFLTYHVPEEKEYAVELLLPDEELLPGLPPPPGPPDPPPPIPDEPQLNFT